MARIRQRETARLAVRVLAMHATVQNFDGERVAQIVARKGVFDKTTPDTLEDRDIFKRRVEGKGSPPVYSTPSTLHSQQFRSSIPSTRYIESQ